MKITIGEYTKFHKILSETFKVPMKWETTLAIEEYLNECESRVAKVAEEFDLEGKRKKLLENLEKELTKKYKKEMKNAKDPETLKELEEKISAEIASSKTGQEETKMIEEFNSIEFEVPVFDYKVDSTLPAMFNLHMRTLPYVNFIVN